MSIKVFVCDCRDEVKIPEKLDFGDDVKIYRNTYLCSSEGVKEIEKVFDPEDRIIIAGCTPRIAERFFSEYEPEFVNIREQVAWVGHDCNKIKDLITGAVNKAKASTKVTRKKVKINNKSVLVIGTGITGLEVTRQVAENGHKVYLIEKEPFIGGTVAKLDRLYPEATPNSHTLYPLINDVITRDNIEILTEAEIVELKGGLGNYTATIKVREPSVTGCILCKICEDVCPVEVDDQGRRRKAIYYVPTYPDSYAVDFEHCTKCGDCVKVSPAKINLEPKTKEVELEVGTIVAATGLSFFDATQIKEYGYGKYPNVLNTIEFERKVASGEASPKTVVIIGCAGSRDEHYLEYCSKICCLIGLKEAKLIKDRFPDTDVYMTYIDMRSYGELENFYTTLRDSHGVNFINGRPAEIFQRGDKLVVKTEDIALGDLLEIEADYVVLSTGFVPNEPLFKLLGVSSKDSFPIEYVSSQLSIDSNPRGIFVAGAAAFPSNVKESLISAREVAASINNLLSQDEVVIKTPVAKIDSEVCGALNCKVCVATCPYGAVKEIEGKIEVDELMCMGCGVCSATCGVGASQLEKYTDEEILAQINGTITEGTVACFLCRWSAYEAADKAGYERLKYPESVRIIRIPCTGRVDPQLVLEAFNSGASGVLVAGCYLDSCHYKSGNFKARRRFLLSRDTLKQFGIDSKRLRIEWIGKDESKKLVEILNEIGSM
jgi:heterodisulfide reductase subunit A